MEGKKPAALELAGQEPLRKLEPGQARELARLDDDGQQVPEPAQVDAAEPVEADKMPVAVTVDMMAAGLARSACASRRACHAHNSHKKLIGRG